MFRVIEPALSMTHRDRLELILLGAIWGASFLFMRVAVPEFGAIALVELRVGIAALFLLWIWNFAHQHPWCDAPVGQAIAAHLQLHNRSVTRGQLSHPIWGYRAVQCYTRYR